MFAVPWCYVRPDDSQVQARSQSDYRRRVLNMTVYPLSNLDAQWNRNTLLEITRKKAYNHENI